MDLGWSSELAGLVGFWSLDLEWVLGLVFQQMVWASEAREEQECSKEDNVAL